jgi:mycothiol synthase
VTLRPWAGLPDGRDRAALTDLLILADEGDPDSGSGHVDESVTRYLVPNPQGVLLAEREGAAIGLTSIAPVGGGVWYSWFTGVVPQMRGRGVGRALKLSALAHARSQGASRVATNNDAVNTPVLRLNELLGYERRPGSRWLHAQIAVAGDGFTTG